MAANGKRQFDALGSSWTLAYDINALCRIEERLGIENAQEFQRTLQKNLSFRTLRALFCCGLSPDATEEQAGEIMSALGIDEVSGMITETIQAAFPNAQGKAGNADAPKPKK
ncbi:MAG: hypothetical protein APF82_01010 [Sphingomonadales bacterium BRH_c42]|nr:MAG: hypothetical protein APF82_01010 [Sphingomonadales bacterium BRH_c42]